jgi:hypothetical protein
LLAAACDCLSLKDVMTIVADTTGPISDLPSDVLEKSFLFGQCALDRILDVQTNKARLLHPLNALDRPPNFIYKFEVDLKTYTQFFTALLLASDTDGTSLVQFLHPLYTKAVVPLKSKLTAYLDDNIAQVNALAQEFSQGFLDQSSHIATAFQSANSSVAACVLTKSFGRTIEMARSDFLFVSQMVTAVRDLVVGLQNLRDDVNLLYESFPSFLSFTLKQVEAFANTNVNKIPFPNPLQYISSWHTMQRLPELVAQYAQLSERFFSLANFFFDFYIHTIIPDCGVPVSLSQVQRTLYSAAFNSINNKLHDLELKEMKVIAGIKSYNRQFSTPLVILKPEFSPQVRCISSIRSSR